MAGRGCRCCSATHVRALPPLQQSHREPCAAVLKQNADTATAAPQGARCCCCVTCVTEPLPLLHCPHCCAAPTAALAPLLCCPRCCAATSAMLPPLPLPLLQEQLLHGTACNARHRCCATAPWLNVVPPESPTGCCRPVACRCYSVVAAAICGASKQRSTTAPVRRHWRSRQLALADGLAVGYIRRQLALADSLAVGQCHDVQVVVPLLLDVVGGEAGGAQRLLRLVLWWPFESRQDKGALLSESMAGFSRHNVWQGVEQGGCSSHPLATA